MKFSSLAAIGLILSAPSAALAHQRWEVAVQGGAAFPTMDLYDTDLEIGYGFEATLGYRFTPTLGVYAGWDWHRFSTADDESAFLGPNADVTETGYVLGLKLEQPLGEPGSPEIVLRGGATLNEIDVDDADGDEIGGTGRGVGFEFGAGLAVPLGDRAHLVPGARFRSLNRELTVDGVTRDVTLSYATAELGVHVSF